MVEEHIRKGGYLRPAAGILLQDAPGGFDRRFTQTMTMRETNER